MRGNTKQRVFFLAFCEFLSDLDDIYRVNRSICEVSWGTSEISIFDPQINILTKMYIFDFSKMAIFRGMTAKIEFWRNWHDIYEQYVGFGLKIPFLNFSCHLIIKIGHIGRIIEKSKLAIF